VKVWDTRSPDCLLAESMHDDKVFDLAWMPEGRLASGGADNKVGLLAW
jgi:WD40 repeat protein